MNPVSALLRLIKSKPLVDQLEKDVTTMSKTNWQTNTLGALTLALALAQIWAPAKWQPQLQKTTAALAGVGLIAAKDHNK